MAGRNEECEHTTVGVLKKMLVWNIKDYEEPILLTIPWLWAARFSLYPSINHRAISAEGKRRNPMGTLNFEGALWNDEESSLFVSEETDYKGINTSNEKESYYTSGDYNNTIIHGDVRLKLGHLQSIWMAPISQQKDPVRGGR